MAYTPRIRKPASGYPKAAAAPSPPHHLVRAQGVGGPWGKQETGGDLALKPLFRKQWPPICLAKPLSPEFCKSQSENHVICPRILGTH